MGCWLSEIGPQNRIVLLRGFPSEALRQAERERYLLADDAFGIGEFLLDMQPTTTACFPSSSPWLPAPTGLSTNCVNTI